MGRGSNLADESEENRNIEINKENYDNLFTWREIKENKKNLIVINDKVYDVSNFKKRHPGGERILMNHIGEDVTDAFQALHTKSTKALKYLNMVQVGKLVNIRNEMTSNQNIEPDKDELKNDFRKLKLQAEKMDLFKADYKFFILHFAHIVVLNILGFLLINFSGHSNWFTYILAIILLTTAQAQAGWSQHDYGHLSVFKSTKLNHLMHYITIGLMKGASADWWNYRHFNHHAKPNVHKKDLDISFGHWMVIGKIFPRELGLQKKGSWPYYLQQYYFFIIIPPLLLPVIFILQNLHHLFKKKDLIEALWFFSFYLTWTCIFMPVLGFYGTCNLYIIVRFFESFWFVFITQMNHLPMHIDTDKQLSWFRMQLLATCNVEQSFFNDWFSGHLNFQIEHHLFPTMPRHNYHKISPYVKSLCQKYNINYENKPLGRALADIYFCLKESGEMWYEAYNM